MWINAATSVGRVRADNQDAYRTGILPLGCYLLVCDGMGGERGGGVASALAADTVAARIEHDVKSGMGETSVRHVLESAGAAANAAVYSRAQADAALTGMGTTLSAVVVTGDTAHVLHVGDSRVYLLREGKLHRLTTDHTVVQMLLERGDLTEKDAENHPQRHYITRAVGAERDILPDVFTIDLQAGDTLMVCSDGLYNELAPDTLTALLGTCVAEKSAQALIDGANRSGGHDNITAAICCLAGEGNALG